jgi:F0F1-type ATP synthase membrane subunit c/vacuolar-type H+-ATPase subunit K
MVEYLIVGLAIIAIVAALSAIGSAIGDGLFVEHAADSASHSVTTNTAGSIGDVLLF